MLVVVGTQLGAHTAHFVSLFFCSIECHRVCWAISEIQEFFEILECTTASLVDSGERGLLSICFVPAQQRMPCLSLISWRSHHGGRNLRYGRSVEVGWEKPCGLLGECVVGLKLPANGRRVVSRRSIPGFGHSAGPLLSRYPWRRVCLPDAPMGPPGVRSQPYLDLENCARRTPALCRPAGWRSTPAGLRLCRGRRRDLSWRQRNARFLP